MRLDKLVGEKYIGDDHLGREVAEVASHLCHRKLLGEYSVEVAAYTSHFSALTLIFATVLLIFALQLGTGVSEKSKTCYCWR